MSDPERTNAILSQLMSDNSEVLGLILLDMKEKTVLANLLPSNYDKGKISQSAFHLYESAETINHLSMNSSGKSITMHLEGVIVFLMSDEKNILCFFTLLEPTAKIGLISRSIQKVFPLLQIT